MPCNVLGRRLPLRSSMSTRGGCTLCPTAFARTRRQCETWSLHADTRCLVRAGYHLLHSLSEEKALQEATRAVWDGLPEETNPRGLTQTPTMAGVVRFASDVNHFGGARHGRCMQIYAVWCQRALWHQTAGIRQRICLMPPQGSRSGASGRGAHRVGGGRAGKTAQV